MRVQHVYAERICSKTQESCPNQPRASTREHAVVGVEGRPSATYDRLRPWSSAVATRGGATTGKGTCCRLDMRVMVLGVREGAGTFFGDGGKTNSVCDGPEEGGGARVLFDENERRNNGGGVG